ncbi:MAG TPA: MlaD family protein [Flavobacterium sp.]|nr:MlaD family protein [Flavobacterium sp.]
MKITKEIKTAILVIASILLFIWGYSFLKGTDLLNSYKTFYVTFDNVEGLATSAPVTINGLTVGKIQSIKLQNSTGKLLVELQVKTDFPISKTSTVNMYEPGIIGGKQLQIIPNLQDQTMAESGDTLRSAVVPGMIALLGQQLSPLQVKVESMLASADSVLINLNKVLDDQNRANLKKTIADLSETMEQFKGASRNLNVILAENKSKINNVMTNFDHASKNISQVSDSLAQARIGETMLKLNNTMTNVDKMIQDVEKGNGTLGKLMKDDKLYMNLNKSSQDLQLLLEDVRLNPTRYINISVFGKKNKPYVAPDVDSITHEKK